MTLLRTLLLGFAIALLTLPAAAQGRTYTTDEAMRERGLDTIGDRLGDNRPLVSVTFTPDEIAIVGQADTGGGFAQWKVRRVNLGVANLHWVSGPIAYPDSGVVDNPSGAYFRDSEIDISRFDAVVAAAVAYAGLKDVPLVKSVEIARTISILPEPAYGEIRWTVQLETTTERATVYLDAGGEVIGGDLSDTDRVEDLDLFTQDDWPAGDAQAALAVALGGARAHSVRVYESYIFVTADHPTDAGLQRDYSWDLSGVRRGLVDTPNLMKLGMGDMATFPWDEVDLTALPRIKSAAREAFASPQAIITGIEASKPTDRAMGELQVLWEIEFRDPNGEEGEVWLDATGNVVEVKLPESRLPAVGPWLAPKTVIDTLRRIRETFGPDAKLSEISINDTQASIDIEDPQAPGEVAHFLMDAREVTRFGSGSYFASLEDSNIFTPADLSGLTVEQLTDMVERTISRLEMKGGEVFRYTFSRHALIMDPGDNRLMVEIRYGDLENNEGGWMTFLLDGTQTDELVP